jgi:hypothetical protein
MAELTLAPRIAAIAARSRITADDVLFLRRMVYADGLSSRHEVENLFALNESCTVRDPEWTRFLVEAVCDYAVYQEKPEGYLSDYNARWLMSLVTKNGVVDGDAELELLVSAIENSKSVPADMLRFTLDQVRNAVVTGVGPLAFGRSLEKGRITKEETDLVRRILYAMGSEGNIAVTRAEAEMLFDINDASVDSLNDPSWHELFIKAVASHMMAVSGYNLGSREDALRHDAFLNDTSSMFSGFFGKMLAGGAEAMKNAWNTGNSVEDAFAETNHARDSFAAQAEEVSKDEAGWVAARIGRDGRMHENERKLIEFLKAESPVLHPDLMALLDKVA